MSPTNKASIFYDIVTEYNDKGAKAAQKSFGGMDKGLAALGKKLTGVFSAAAIEEFARRSVQAFAKEDAALKVLGQTLGNIGLGFKAVEVNSFITKLAESTGVMKETLFPAFETLIRYTGDVGKAQDLLKLSLDVSAGTGKDTAAVALALGKAYGGNTTALGRLGAGLTKAELSSKNFALVQGRLATLFKGDASSAADSFQGKINRLKVAFTEMQVQVGEGLTSALTTLGGNDGIQTLIDGMNRFGTSIKDASIGLSDLIGQISKIPGMGVIGNIGKVLSKNVLFDYLQSHGKKIQADAISNDTYTQQKRTLVASNALTNQKNLQLAADKKALQVAKDKAALDKASAALKLAGTVFDMSQIEIVAALQRNVTDDQKTRLELQLALLTSNATAAATLTQKLLETQIEALQVEKANPFFAWTDALQAALQALIDLQTQMAKFAPIVPTSAAAASAIILGQDASAAIASANDPAYAQNTTAVNDFLSSSIDSNLATDAMAAQLDALVNGSATAGTSSSSSSSLSNGSGFFGGGFTPYNPMNGNVNVTVMLDSNQVTSYVNNVNQNSTIGGTQLTTSRINQAAIG